MKEVFEDICKTAARTTMNGIEGNMGLSRGTTCVAM